MAGQSATLWLGALFLSKAQRFHGSGIVSFGLIEVSYMEAEVVAAKVSPLHPFGDLQGHVFGTRFELLRPLYWRPRVVVIYLVSFAFGPGI